MKKQIRVLMIVPNLRVSNGVASYAMNYFRALDHDKVHMDFCLVDDIATPYYQEIKDLGSNYFILPKIKKPISQIKECRRILKEGKYDILHNNILLGSILLMRCAKAENVPVRLLHSHNSKLGETVKKEKRNALFVPLIKNAATDYAACSKLAAEALFGDVEYDFVPNIISEDRVQFSPEKRGKIRKDMSAENKIVIGSIGRVAAQKNPIFALDVIREVIKRNPSVEYWWIGSGPMDSELKQGVAERGIQGHVRILGSREDVPDLLQAMDIFFLPSLFEGLPVTGVEAQAAGLPSVISDAVTKEMVYTDLVEFVSLEKPVQEWIEVIEKQIMRVPERRSYIEELRNSPFSEHNAGKYLTQIYEQLVEKRKSIGRCK